MGSKALIEGDRYARSGSSQQGGFLDIAGTVQTGVQGIGNPQTGPSKADKRAQAQSITDNKVAGWIGKMGKGVDISALSDTQQKNVQSFLRAQKSEYAKAASEIVKYGADSPEYMRYTDIMNNVNRSFKQLATSIGNYKQNQMEYIEDFDKGMISKGNGDSYNQAGNIYDPESDMMIDNSGHIQFNMDGNTIDYRNFQEPFLKDYKTAQSILDMTAKFAKSKEPLSKYQASSVRLKLDSLFSENPDSMRSLVKDKLLSNEVLGGIPDEYLDDPSKSEELKTMLLDKLMTGFQYVSAMNTKKGLPSGDNNIASIDRVKINGAYYNQTTYKNGSILNVLLSKKELKKLGKDAKASIVISKEDIARSNSDPATSGFTQQGTAEAVAAENALKKRNKGKVNKDNI